MAGIDLVRTHPILLSGSCGKINLRLILIYSGKSPSTWRYPEWFRAGHPGRLDSLWRSECVQYPVCPIKSAPICSACEILALIVHMSTWSGLTKETIPAHVPRCHFCCCDKTLTKCDLGEKGFCWFFFFFILKFCFIHMCVLPAGMSVYGHGAYRGRRGLQIPWD